MCAISSCHVDALVYRRVKLMQASNLHCRLQTCRTHLHVCLLVDHCSRPVHMDRWRLGPVYLRSSNETRLDETSR